MIRRKLKLVVSAFGIAIAIYFFIDLALDYNFIQDDSYISFRYAENFAAGKGLVFNEGEQVEGYTNFLWVLILTLFKILGFDLESISQILSVSFGALSLLVTYKISKLFEFNSSPLIGELFNLTTPILLALTGGFAYWSVSGMETSLFTFFILSGFYFLLRDLDKIKPNYGSIIFFILASLTRPEGIFLFLLTFFLKFVFLNKNKKDVSDKPILKELLIYLIPVTLHILFRLIYYGYPFPNTFYAKAGVSEFFLKRGYYYIAEFTSANLIYGVLLAVPLILIFSKKYRVHFFIIYTTTIIFYMAIILIGGDVLPFHRLFIPLLPILYVLVVKAFEFISAISLSEYQEVYKKTFSFSLICLLLLTGFVNLKRERPKLNDLHAVELGLVYKMKNYAGWVKDRQEEENRTATVALSTIGAFSYYSGSKIIDLLGLTNEYIAHHPKEMKGISEPLTRKWVERTYNAAYVLEQQPDYIVFPAGYKPSAFPESALFIDPLFKKLYYPQLLYQNKINELFPIYSLRPEQSRNKLNLPGERCEENALINFIVAINQFLKFTRTRDSRLIPKIIEYSNRSLELCPLHEDDILTLLGMLNYFTGEFGDARKFFDKAIKIDDYNTLAHFYLINIFRKENNNSKMLLHLRKLKKISPHTFPNFKLSTEKPL